MEKYKVDDSARHIKLEVDVGTNGIAVTTVFLDKDGTTEKLFESEDFAGGDIPYTKVGINRKLKNTILDIQTAVDLSNIPPERWQDEINNSLVMVSMLRGGPDGEKKYKLKVFEIDQSGLPDVFIGKKIKIK